MKKTRRVLAFCMALLMVVSTILMDAPVMTAYAASTVSITKSGGWFETAYVEWSAVSGANAYRVYVKPASSADSAYVQLDNELVRKYPSNWRADALGLKAGSYVLKVEALSSGSVVASAVTSAITVSAHDRSGFVFSSNSPAKSGVGAYNNDGTLKANAKVLYVTEATKNSVKMKIGSTEYTGVAAITQAIKTKNSCPPVAIRIIGQVTLSGIVCSDLASAYALGVKGAENVTIEGVGEDATLYTAGVAVFSSKSIEVRNLGLMNWGGGKDGDGVSLKATLGAWIHNCDFFYGDAGSDGDQAKGDGSMDLKDDSQYVTISYNHFYDSGKMSLCGMKSESGDNYITYHHNWFDHSDSRHPRIRRMSVHVYNNYFDGNAKYGSGVTYGGNAFIEANYYRNCPYPFLISGQGADSVSGGTLSGEAGGGIKAYNNVFSGKIKSLTYANAGSGTAGATTAASTTGYDAYLASSRTETVPSTYKCVNGAFAYNNFDTKVDLGVSTSAIDDPSKIPTIVQSKAGRMNGGDFKWSFTTSDDSDYHLNSALKTSMNSYKTSLVSVGGDSSSTPVAKYSVTVNNGSASVSQATAGTQITITANTVAGKTFTGWTVNSNNVTLVSKSSATTTFTMPSADVTVTANYTTAGGTDPTEETTTAGGSGSVTAGEYFNHFTGSQNNNSKYQITGSYSNSKGSVTYGGKTYTECLKIESATNISFSVPTTGTLTLVFLEVNKSGAIKIDGTNYTSDANGVVTAVIASGSHVLTKANSTNLFVMDFAASGSESGSTNPTDPTQATTAAAVHTHNYTAQVTKTATCMETGVMTYTCIAAGTCSKKTYTEVIPKAAHNFSSNYTVDVAATATTAGSKSRHCLTSGCTEKTDITSIPATGSGSSSATLSYTTVGGASETLYATISGITAGQVTSVSYTGTMSGSLSATDLQYLVRNVSNGVRIDIPGIKPGTYTLNVVTTKGTASQAGIEVRAYDRSGYAHFNYTEGVGAYKDDGTLKPNAIVLYVTEENKNTVTLTYGGITVSGIGNILNSAGATPRKDVDKPSVILSNVVNTNQGILKKLAENNIPLVVRIVGKVSNITDIKDPGSTQTLKGLTAYDSYDYGGTEGDSGSLARMKSAKNITIEGIGTDANIDGWGLHFVCDTGSPELGKSFEVRNIAFTNVPEDSVGMEGHQSGSTIDASVERCWIHNNSFKGANFTLAAESDKKEGDGSIDFKRGQYLTVSYNYFEAAHKTNLVGSSDSSLQFNLTYHHNIWYMCKARGPLTRQANVHMYNNLIMGQTDFSMNTRANAYIFSESNMFYADKNPYRVDAGAIKSYNDSLASCLMNANSATTVANKSDYVSNSCKYGSIAYDKFDTDSKLSYIPSGNYELQEDLTEARKVLFANTGVLKENPVTPSQVKMSDISIVPDGVTAQQITSLPYTTLPGKSGKVEKTVFAFTVNGTFDITLKYTDESDTGTGVLVNEAGVAIKKGSGTVQHLPAGTYVIQPFCIQAGAQNPLTLWQFKSFTLTEFKISAADSSVHYHNYSTSITKAPTCIAKGVKTYTCIASGTCDKKTYTEEIAMTAHSYASTYTTDVEATATTAGSKSRHCTTPGCTAKTDVTTIPATGSGSSGGGEESNKVTAVFDATELVGSNNDLIADGELFADGYIKAVGTIAKKNRKNSDGTYSADVVSVEFANGDSDALYFKVNGTATVTINVSSSNSGYGATVALLDSKGGAIANAQSKSVVTGGSGAKDTLTYTVSSGEYKLVSPKDEANNKGLRVYDMIVEGDLVSYSASSSTSHIHNYTSETTTPATCIAKGVKTYTCTASGTCDKKTYTEEIAMTDHVYSSEYTVDVEATSTTPGSKSRHCMTDGCTSKIDVTTIPVNTVSYKDLEIPETGFVVGNVYGNSSEVKFTVLEDMPKKNDSSLAGYTTYYQGINNPTISANGIPTAGAAFKVEAVKNAKVTFKIKNVGTSEEMIAQGIGSATKADSAKTYYVIDSNGNTIATASMGNDVVKAVPISFDMNAGDTYYMYVKSSKIMVLEIGYTLSAASNSKVSGTITSATTGTATVQLLNKEDRTIVKSSSVSGASAAYLFENVAKGDYILKVTKDGYAMSEVEVVVGSSDVVKNIDLLLDNIKYSHSLTLNNNLSINYYVAMNVLEGFSDIKLNIEKDVYDQVGNKDVQKSSHNAEVSGSEYRFIYANVAAKEAGNEVRATLSGDKNGVTYTFATDVYSVGTYCYSRLEKSSDEKLKCLVVDLLNYCSAAQEYFGVRTDTLVNKDLTSEQKSLGSVSYGTLTSCENVLGISNTTATITGKSLVLNNNIELKIYATFSSDSIRENSIIRIEYMNRVGDTVTEDIPYTKYIYESSTQEYSVTYAGLKTTDFRSPVSVTVMKNGQKCSSTLVYSVETYVYNRMQKSSNETLKKLLGEMMKYSDSAAAYFKK